MHSLRHARTEFARLAAGSSLASGCPFARCKRTVRVSKSQTKAIWRSASLAHLRWRVALPLYPTRMRRFRQWAIDASVYKEVRVAGGNGYARFALDRVVSCNAVALAACYRALPRII